MTTSGTYNFMPGLGEIIIYAYQNIGVRPTSVLQEHMESARMATNMMLSRWSNEGVNLWAVDLVTVDLSGSQAVLTVTGNGSATTLTYAATNTPIYTIGSQISVTGTAVVDGVQTVTASSRGSVSFSSLYSGTKTGGAITGSAATYSVDGNTVMILDAYMVTGGIDRVIMPISRTEYASYPNKATQGITTSFWFDRLISPNITLWPVPDGTAPQLKYYRVRQVQDANMQNGEQVEIPYRWLEALSDGLAYRLARIWNPQIAPTLKMQADESYQIAAAQDVENVPTYLSPMISGYFR